MVSAYPLLFFRACLSWGFFLVTTQVVVVHESTTLHGLCREVCDVAAEQEHVSRLDLPRESHEYKGVHAQSWNKKSKQSFSIPICSSTTTYRTSSSRWWFGDLFEYPPRLRVGCPNWLRGPKSECCGEEQGSGSQGFLSQRTVNVANGMKVRPEEIEPALTYINTPWTLCSLNYRKTSAPETWTLSGREIHGRLLELERSFGTIYAESKTIQQQNIM